MVFLGLVGLGLLRWLWLGALPTCRQCFRNLDRGKLGRWRGLRSASRWLFFLLFLGLGRRRLVVRRRLLNLGVGLLLFAGLRGLFVCCGDSRNPWWKKKVTLLLVRLPEISLRCRPWLWRFLRVLVRRDRGLCRSRRIAGRFLLLRNSYLDWGLASGKSWRLFWNLRPGLWIGSRRGRCWLRSLPRRLRSHRLRLRPPLDFRNRVGCGRRFAILPGWR